MNDSLTMYCVTHKNLKKYPKGRTPIFVGNGSNDSHFLTDATGDNISYKNKNYCELTAMYWIWKNDHKSKYVSIEHYRRFFFDFSTLSPISYHKMFKLFDHYDLIETRPYYFEPSVGGYYGAHHYASDLKVVREAIEQLYPEYLNSYDKIMNGNETSACNMVAMSKIHFDAYCEWIFKVLEYVEKHINISDRDDYQKRVYGFLSERLQNVWVDKQNMSIKKFPIYFVEDSRLRSIRISIKSRH